MKKLIWLAWIIVTFALAGYFYYKIFEAEDKRELLIGDTTYGHHQIEMECSACHTDPFGGKEVLQDACLNCHKEELEHALDSHPKKKFTDPREAYRLEIIDARYCISCHTEHHRDRTQEMGLTLPDDYCYHCHKEVGEERESHKDLPFDSCASAGCHNFHDNRALYEAFLVKNANQPWLLEIAKITHERPALDDAKSRVNPATNAFENKMSAHANMTAEWQASSHANAGVNCGGCHTDKEDPNTWIDHPNEQQCATCHINETKTFKQGKHGMRLATNVYENNISPAEGHLEFSEQSSHAQHGCNSCHNAHSFDTKIAAVDSCLNCHSDEHSLSYKNSPHAKINISENSSAPENSAPVTCATCHMPRIEKNIDGIQRLIVDHNQNYNLRPNEKMIRPVCMNCHGLEFSIDALADKELIKNNFNGKPGIHIESVDWSIKRVKH